MSMKEFNLTRLMDACVVNIDKEVYDDLFDYWIDYDLNEINIDDMYVNGVQFLDNDDIDEDTCIITKTENGAYCFT